MAPTRIYVKPLLELINTLDVHALSHITGGGLTENIPRVLPENCKAVIDCESWTLPGVFAWLQGKGNVEAKEMVRTFNCGIGMVICVAKEDAERAQKLLQDAGETVYNLGHIASCEADEEQVELLNLSRIEARASDRI